MKTANKATVFFRILSLGFLVLMTNGTPAFADPIEDVDCESIGPQGSANGDGCMAEQAVVEYRRLQKEAYKRLLAFLSKKITGPDAINMDERIISSFEGAQAAWEKYYPKECALTGALSMGASPWQSTHSIQCEAQQLEDRFEKLNKALICLEKIPEDVRFYEGGVCLYPFIPLSKVTYIDKEKKVQQCQKISDQRSELC